jgi:hypothetical protein
MSCFAAWALLPLAAAHERSESPSDADDYSRADVMYACLFMLVLLFCVFWAWLGSGGEMSGPHIIRHTIVLPTKGGRNREYELEDC